MHTGPNKDFCTQATMWAKGHILCKELSFAFEGEEANIHDCMFRANERDRPSFLIFYKFKTLKYLSRFQGKSDF